MSRGVPFSIFTASLILLLACSEESFELNRAMYAGLPYVKRIVHPAFPGPDSTRSDSLLSRLQRTWDDLEAILPLQQEDGLLEIGSHIELDYWLAEFWRVRDPDPTTAINEYREQHESRLLRVRETYPAPEPPWYDDRGWALLRFGEPESAVAEGAVASGGWAPPVEVWKMGDMLMAFQSFTNSGVFRLCGIPHGREWMFRTLAGGGPRSLVMLENFEILEESDVIVRGYELEEEPLWLAVAADCYRAPGLDDDMTLLRVFYQLRDNDLDVRERQGLGGIESAIEEAFALSDIESRRVIFDGSVEKTFVRSKYEIGRRYLSGQFEQAALAGPYLLTLRLEDKVSGRAQIFTREIELRRFPTGELALSDISLYNCRVPEGPLVAASTGFGIPHPMASFLPRMIPGFRFEIYGLKANIRGRKRYALSYTVRRGGKALISSKFLEDSEQEIVARSLVLDMSQLEPGEHTLEVTVTDLIAAPWAIDPGATRVRVQRRFTIVDHTAE